MSVRIACGLSTASDPRAGRGRGRHEGRRRAGGAHASTSPSSSRPARTSRRPRRRSRASTRRSQPDVLIGCGAGGVVGDGREIEGGTAVDRLGRGASRTGSCSTFHAEVTEVEDGVAIAGVPDLQGAGGGDPAARPLLVPDRRGALPSSPSARRACRSSAGSPAPARCAARRRCSSASASSPAARVGVRFDGVELLPCVSQGATPIGPELRSPPARGGSSASSPGARRSARCARCSTDSTTPSARCWPRACCWASSSSGGLRRPRSTATSSCAASSAATRRRARSPSARRSSEGQVVRVHARDAALGRPRPARRAGAAPRGARRRRRRPAR